jgi:hypothetical protein
VNGGRHDIFSLLFSHRRAIRAANMLP